MADTRDPVMITLASRSPRRRQLLALTSWQVEVSPATVNEEPVPGETAPRMACRLAMEKARAVESGSSVVALGADTVVVDGDRLLGKPADAEDAARMLERLAGRAHRVITALTLVDRTSGVEIFESCETIVPMRDYSAAEVAKYVASGAPLDKAGAYGIQDCEFRPVAIERLRGCYANVMGLPLCHLVRGMRCLGHPAQVDIPVACQAHTGFECRVYSQILRAAV